MALSTKLELRQGQQLVMTPQLQQAIRLLQLSNIELTQYVESRARAQPAARESTTAPKRRVRTEIEASSSPSPKRRRRQRDRLRRPRQAGSRSPKAPRYRIRQRLSRQRADADSANGQDASGWASLRQRASGSGDDVNIEAFVASDVSLREHLAAQLPLALKEPVERLIGQHLDRHGRRGRLPARRSRVRR